MTYEGEFLSHLDDGTPSLTKGSKGGGTFASHAARLHKAHAAMATHCKAMHDGMDDEHEMKAHFGKLHAHHAELASIYKSVGTDLSSEEAHVNGDVSLGGAGSTLPTGDLHGPKAHKATDIRPDGVRIAGEIPAHLRLIPRGGAGAGLEKAQVSEGNEDMFDV